MSPVARSATPTLSHSREDQVRKVKNRMAAPRFQMMLMLAVTGGVGFLTSYMLLQAGMDSMAARYPIAVGVAYLVFFLLLRIWISLQHDPLEHVGDILDAADAVEGVASLADGGQVGSTPHSDSDLPSFGFDLADGDSVVFLVVVAAVGAVALGAVFYVLYLAPLLLAEVLVDGVLLVGLYRRLKRPQPQYWVFGAIRRTWVPAAIVAVTFFVAGAVFQDLAPGARSIGGVWKAVSSEQR
jgi:FtsH-binding integral membrane protein